MLSVNYCACCGKRFYRTCEAKMWAYKAKVHSDSSSSEEHLFMCSYECHIGVRNEQKEFAKRWKKVKRLASVLLDNDAGFARSIDNIYEFVIKYPTILKGGNSYDKGLLKDLKNSELQRNRRKEAGVS